MRYSPIVLLAFSLLGCGHPGTVPKKVDSPNVPPATPKRPESESQRPQLSPEEATFVKGLNEFLDYCDGTARLMEDSYYDIGRRTEKTTDLYAAIPNPPSFAGWAANAMAEARKLKSGIAAEGIFAANEEEWVRAIGSSEAARASDTGKDMDSRHAKVVTEIREQVRKTRRLIPTAN